jgi:hypothetical protein
MLKSHRNQQKPSVFVRPVKSVISLGDGSNQAKLRISLDPDELVQLGVNCLQLL